VEDDVQMLTEDAEIAQKVIAETNNRKRPWMG
jgi:hypothetical protein